MIIFSKRQLTEVGLVKWLFFISLICAQFQMTQVISYVLLLGLSFVTLIKNFTTVGKAKKSGLFFLFVWSFMIVYMLRGEYLMLTETMVEVFWLTLGCISFVIISFSKELDRVTTLKLVVFAGGIGAAVNLVAYRLSWYNPHLINSPYAGTRWVGGFDGPNESAAFYVMILALVLGLYLEKNISSLNTIIMFSIVTPLIYISFSRGALLSFAGLFIIFVLYSFVKSRRKIALLTIYTITLWIFFSKYYGSLFERFTYIRRSASERGYLFTESMRLFTDKPVLGHGFGSFETQATVYNVVPHSDYLLFLVSGGIIGATLLVLFYLGFTFKAFRKKFYPELLLLIVFMTQALTFNNIVRGRLSVLFWIIVILVYLGTKESRIKKTPSVWKKIRIVR